MLSDRDSRVLGSTRYLDVNERHRGVVIGWTYHSPGSRGTVVNQSASLYCWCTRSTAGALLRSSSRRTTATALAARYTEARREVRGTLGNHIIRQGGTLRDSTLYSKTSEEWPTVKEGLLKRLTEQRFEPGRAKSTLGFAPLVRPGMGENDQRQKPAYPSPPREMDVDGTEGKYSGEL